MTFDRIQCGQLVLLPAVVRTFNADPSRDPAYHSAAVALLDGQAVHTNLGNFEDAIEYAGKVIEEAGIQQGGPIKVIALETGKLAIKEENWTEILDALEKNKYGREVKERLEKEGLIPIETVFPPAAEANPVPDPDPEQTPASSDESKTE